MHRRLNVTLPEATLRLLYRVAHRGDRSRLIDRALRHYLEDMGRTALRKRLKEGALHRAERDLRLAEEWFDLQEEAWQRARP
jgi:CopG family transcriptional regulator/antitoxin EndoAI